MVGTSYQVTIEGRAVEVGEYARVLFEQERAERQNVAALAERVAKLGLDQASTLRSAGARPGDRDHDGGRRGRAGPVRRSGGAGDEAGRARGAAGER